MERSKIHENLEKKPLDIDFHDLEAILRQGLGNAELKVIDHRSECLSRADENYMNSVVMKIDATIRRYDDCKKEVLHLVAKTKIPGEKYLGPWIVCIQKEIFAYTELLPTYRDIEREAGVPESEIIDIMPKYMGHRNSFRRNNGEVDKDSIVLMENMKTKGYYNIDIRTGLALEPAEKALTSLARYHGLGLAMKEKSPTFTQIATQIAETKFSDDNVEAAYDLVRKAFQKYPRLGVYTDAIELSIAYMQDKWFSAEEKPVGLWDSISHGDFWSNNVLFHNDHDGRVDDVKIVDWSLYLPCSVLADLPYFFCTSVQRATLDKHFDALLDLYYSTLVATMERVGCDAAAFTRESFDMELKQQAINELAQSALVANLIYCRGGQEDEANRELLSNARDDESDSYEVSLMRIIEIYKSRDWL